MGNAVLGNGVGEYEVYEINRETDEELLHNLKHHKEQLEYHQKEIDKIQKILDIPIEEKFLYKHKIGILPTKE